jgi:hypothetical protein
LYILELIAERKIQEAIEEGAFDHLEGKGQPLAGCDKPFEDSATRMAHRLLKNNGFTPAWIAEAKEIENDAAVLQNEAKRGAGRERLEQRLADMNRRIDRFNLTVPVRGKEKRRIRLDDVLKRPATR